MVGSDRNIITSLRSLVTLLTLKTVPLAQVSMALQSNFMETLNTLEDERAQARLMREEMEESKMTLALTESQVAQLVRERDEAVAKEKHLRGLLRDTTAALNYRTDKYIRKVKEKKLVTGELSSLLMLALSEKNGEIKR